MGIVKAGAGVLGIATDDATLGQRPVPLWGRLLFVASVVAMVLGLVLPMVNSGSPSGVGAGFNIPASAAAALTGDNHADGALSKSDAPIYASSSPMMFRLGFGFFVGFVAAFTARAYLRTALAALAFFFITGYGLQHEGLVDVKWDAMQERYLSVRADLSAGTPRTSEHSGGLVKYWPVMAAAGVGLVAGFVRRRR